MAVVGGVERFADSLRRTARSVYSDQCSSFATCQHLALPKCLNAQWRRSGYAQPILSLARSTVRRRRLLYACSAKTLLASSSCLGATARPQATLEPVLMSHIKFKSDPTHGKFVFSHNPLSISSSLSVPNLQISIELQDEPSSFRQISPNPCCS